MALVTNGFWMTVTLLDAANVPSTLEYQLRAADMAAALTAATEIIGDLVPLTQSKIKAYQVGERYVEDAFTPAAAGANNKIKGLVTGLIDGEPSKSAVFAIPAPVDAIFGTPGTKGYNIIDLANALITDYSNDFRAAGQAYISDGEDLGTLTEGRRVTRASGNP
jgi:hypothetical protein